MKKLFKNAHISLDGKSFTLFLDNEPILSDTLLGYDDWYGFELNGEQYDLNIWEDDEPEMRKASIYTVSLGKTDTYEFIGITVLNNK